MSTITERQRTVHKAHVHVVLHTGMKSKPWFVVYYIQWLQLNLQCRHLCSCSVLPRAAWDLCCINKAGKQGWDWTAFWQHSLSAHQAVSKRWMTSAESYKAPMEPVNLKRLDAFNWIWTGSDSEWAVRVRESSINFSGKHLGEQNTGKIVFLAEVLCQTICCIVKQICTVNWYCEQFCFFENEMKQDRDKRDNTIQDCMH